MYTNDMKLISTLPILLILVLLMIFLISVISSTRTKSLKQNRQELENINKMIELGKHKLDEINNQIQNRTLDRSVSLTQIQIKVLDIYDKSHIKIPADIIEDLSVMDLETEKDIYDYIENQRNYWKLENTKKPFILK